MDERKIIQLHEEILYPTVRVRGKKGGGSGTVVYSDRATDGIYHTYVITNFHVVDDNVKIEKVWDSVLGMDVKKELKTPSEADLFYYEHHSRCKGVSGSHKANIRAYDKQEDIALLELEKEEEPVRYVAKLYPKDEVNKVKVFDKIYACGASLLHEPITTKGVITFMSEIIDDYEYWMMNCPIIFGNSGGSVFRKSEERNQYEYIGIPSRVAVSGMGFAPDPITHMAWFVPISRIYDFLDRNEYQFIYDKGKTIEQCQERRKKRRDENRKLLMARAGSVQPEDDK